jgi:hypothetical protein
MKPMTLLLALAVLLLLTSAALSQDGYDLSWWTVDAGVLTGGGYTLGGGFWGGGETGQPPAYPVYLPLIVSF